MLISIHELTLTCKNSKKIALNSREVGVLDQSSLPPGRAGKDLSKHLGPFRLWKLSVTFCSLIFTIDIAKKRQPKALEWNSEFGWQVLEAKKYHTILLPCYLKMVHLHIHLYKKCIWTIFISIQRIEYHIYTPINMF